MPFRAEVSRLLDIVVHSLYSEKEIFLRELISNASDACDKLRYESITNPALFQEAAELNISIKIDKKNRTLTVKDNGIGMSREELIENLGTIARSGTSTFLEQLSNKNGGSNNLNLIGQFGVGFYAAFMVSEKVEVKSLKAGSSEGHLWISDGKGEFSVSEVSGLLRGTEVVLHLKKGEDEFLDIERCRSIIHKYSDHIAFPVILNEEEKPSNRGGALWLRPKQEVTQEQYSEFYHHAAHAHDEPSLTLHWRAEGKIEYTGLLFVPSVKPFDLFDPKRRHGVKLFVKRVFITDFAEGLIAPYLRFLRGVVDSEDLPLNISREMLQTNLILSKIRQGITRRVLAELNKFSEDNPDAFAKIWDNFGAVIKEGLYEDTENRTELLKLFRCRTTHGEHLVSLSDYVKRMKEGQDAIYFMCGESIEKLNQNPHLEGFRAKDVEVLLLTDQVDDFWPMTVGEYEGIVFRSVTRAGEGLSKIRTDITEPSPQAQKDIQNELGSLIALMKTTLGESVKDVRASDRLTASPVCLVADEGDIDIHLERFLKQHNQIRTASKRILELNPSHSLIMTMANQVKVSGSSDRLSDIAWLLFDQARLLDGETLTDPIAFSRRLEKVLGKAAAA